MKEIYRKNNTSILECQNGILLVNLGNKDYSDVLFIGKTEAGQYCSALKYGFNLKLNKIVSSILEENNRYFNSNYFFDNYLEYSNCKSILSEINSIINKKEDILEFGKILNNCMQKITKNIDEEVINCLKCISKPKLTDFDFFSVDGVRGKYRRQAANSFPLFAGVMSSNLSIKIAIDRGHPLMDVLIKSLNCLSENDLSKAVLKKMALVKQKPIFDIDVETIVKFATMVPVDWIKTDNIEEWNSFCVIADVIINNFNANSDQVKDLVSGCSGKWTDFARRCAKSFGYEGDNLIDIYSVIRLSSIDYLDVINNFANLVILPLSTVGINEKLIDVTSELLNDSKEVSKLMLITGKSLPKLFEESNKWHNNRNRIMEIVPSNLSAQDLKDVINKSQTGWIPLSDEVVSPNGLSLVPLRTEAELKKEGQIMGHCVGSYGTKAKSGQCHIVSVREGNKSIATVEFSLQDGIEDGLKLKIIQNKGVHNSSPSSEAKDSVDWYMKSLERNFIPNNYVKIKAYLGEKIFQDSLERVCNYDWRNVQNINTVLAPWAPYVATDVKKMSFEDLVNCNIIANIRNKIPVLVNSNYTFK